MANQRIFCNTPWYEAHIYWDGGLGICCQESRRLTTDPEYNIKNITLKEWFNSEPVRQFRKDILSDNPTDLCKLCYHEEAHADSSRRIKANQKSVIFTKNAFDESFKQSPGYQHFEYSQEHDGHTNTLPIDLHIDLGNHCNLACKMCHPRASSKIASQYIQWGLSKDKTYLGSDWTKDQVTWNRFCEELLSIPKLKNIHPMGGETLLSPRFEQLVDFLIEHKRFDICFSFVTNGTVYNPTLIEKLKKFQRVGIEISIETITEHNDYIRQGCSVGEVLENITKYKKLCDGSKITLTLRPAVSALSVGYYHTLLKWSLEQQLVIKSLLVIEPNYLDIRVLPKKVRSLYRPNYEQLLKNLNDIDLNLNRNESDPNNYKQSIKQQCLMVLNLLDQEDIPSQNLMPELVGWCSRWDNKFNFNALTLYPELAEEFKLHDYHC